MNDLEITLWTPKETVRLILIKMARSPTWNTGMPRKRRSGLRGVPGQTIEREKRLRSSHASIRKRKGRLQINKIGGDRRWDIFHSFMERLTAAGGDDYIVDQSAIVRS